jgi:hypothetical protein
MDHDHLGPFDKLMAGNEDFYLRVVTTGLLPERMFEHGHALNPDLQGG